MHRRPCGDRERGPGSRAGGSRSRSPASSLRREIADRPRLGLRERVRAAVVAAARRLGVAPPDREVAVQVDAVGVLALLVASPSGLIVDTVQSSTPSTLRVAPAAAARRSRGPRARHRGSRRRQRLALARPDRRSARRRACGRRRCGRRRPAAETTRIRTAAGRRVGDALRIEGPDLEQVAAVTEMDRPGGEEQLCQRARSRRHSKPTSAPLAPGEANRKRPAVSYLGESGAAVILVSGAAPRDAPAAPAASTSANSVAAAKAARARARPSLSKHFIGRS